MLLEAMANLMLGGKQLRVTLFKEMPILHNNHNATNTVSFMTKAPYLGIPQSDVNPVTVMA